MTSQTSTELYGCETLGRLTRVLLHEPGAELGLINSENCGDWLFDCPPCLDGYIEEHRRYADLLRSHGVRVHYLSEFLTPETRRLATRMPNLTFLHDIAVVTTRGAILSRMAFPGRRDEQVIVQEALRTLNIPILTRFDAPEDCFEGCLLLSNDTLLVAETERYTPAAVWKFIRSILHAFPKVIYVRTPRARRYMHPDTIFNRIDDDLALVYLPAFLSTLLITREGIRPIDFADWMRRRGVTLVNVSDEEQRNLACTFVPLDRRVMFHYDTALSADTQKTLARRGVEILFFPARYLKAGGGSLRCHTLRLHREGNVPAACVESRLSEATCRRLNLPSDPLPNPEISCIEQENV